MSDLGDLLRGNFWDYIWSKFTGATAKTTPIDGDGIGIVDSADANAIKLLTLTNLWANYLDAKVDALVYASPISWDCFAGQTYTSVGAGTWGIAASYVVAGYTVGPLSNEATHADGDNVTFTFYLPAGTYRLDMSYINGTDKGKFDTTIDGGATLGLTDGYGSGGVPKGVHFTGISIAAGAHNIKFQLNGKHASSSDHILVIYGFALTRTA